jgi:hypothetical protein
MVATPHLLVGAALAQRARGPAGAFALGVASHFALDLIPHKDYAYTGPGRKALCADLGLGTTATWALCSGRRRHALLAGAVGGALPDVLQACERALGLRLTRRLHGASHWWRPPVWVGVSTQVAVSTLAARSLAEGRLRA